MRVKLLTGMAGAHFSHVSGDVLDVSDDQGLHWIARGIAERAPIDVTAELALLRHEVAMLRAEVAGLMAIVPARTTLPLDPTPVSTAGRRGAR